MNNNNNDYIIGEFTSPQTASNQTPLNLIIDNNTLYKKLIEIEMEIKSLKMLINSKNSQQIYASQPKYYLPQRESISEPKIPQFWNTPTNLSWKDNQSVFR